MFFIFFYIMPIKPSKPPIICTAIISLIYHWICLEPTLISTIWSSSPIGISDIIHCFKSLFCEIESYSSLCCFWNIGRSFIDSLHDYEHPHWEHKYYNKNFYQSETTKRFFLAEFSIYVLHIKNFKVNTECTLAILFSFSREKKQIYLISNQFLLIFRVIQSQQSAFYFFSTSNLYFLENWDCAVSIWASSLARDWENWVV